MNSRPLLITGATGFIGRYVTAELLRRGHALRAIVRPGRDASALPWLNHPHLGQVTADLTQADGLADAVAGTDAVIHLAAAKTGDWATQTAQTLTATKNLLQAMAYTGVRRLVQISSFSVYDYQRLPENSLLTEASPLEAAPHHRDIYAQMKLAQEEQVRQFAAAQNGRVTILRPGIVYGRGQWWTAGLGANLRNWLWLRIGRQAPLPLTYVENCAIAIAQAIERPAAIGQTLNLVDDPAPTQDTYVRLLAERGLRPHGTIPISWGWMRQAADLMESLDDHLHQRLGRRLKRPGLLTPASLHARVKPLRYSSDRARQVLQWSPRYSLPEALDRCQSSLALPVLSPEVPLPRGKQMGTARPIV
ncbi:MAG: NAD-dependent epimerase/dehydratase family protein [Synechococcales bacterium]|nr:NAD-dependent epimerase/dehydratase family protein [Synechococcales bacterium]